MAAIRFVAAALAGQVRSGGIKVMAQLSIAGCVGNRAHLRGPSLTFINLH
jgi:hypothetical protein